MFGGNTRADNVVYAADIHERAQSTVSSHVAKIFIPIYAYMHQNNTLTINYL